MNYYFISGTSSGIGKALAENLLQDESNIVYGFSRRKTIEHRNFKHNMLDFSKVEKVAKFEFPKLNNAEKIILINNAGTLGDIKHIGNLSAQSLIDVFNVNLTALAVLCNAFIKQYQTIATEKIIINISSGAATGAYDGWATYCSSKAGVNMLTEVIDMEQKNKTNPIKIFAIAPGVVDTAMQTTIRKTSVENFSRIEKFNQLKTTKALYSPKAVAQKIIDYCQNTDAIPALISRIVMD